MNGTSVLCGLKVPPEVAKQFARLERFERNRSAVELAWGWQQQVHDTMRAAGFVLKVTEQ